MAEQYNKDRVDELLNVISAMDKLDFSKRLETETTNTPLDKIALGLNKLGEKLENNVVEKSLLTYKNEKLNEALSDYKHALDQSAIVVITDTKGNVEYVNDMYIKASQYSKKEIIGQNQRIVNSGYHTPKFWKEMWTKIGNGNVWSSEVKNKAKDGSIFWIDMTIVPFLNSKGKPVRYLAICHNISIRKQRAEELEIYRQKLEQANENLEKFAYTAAHDMKSPLNAANGLIYLLESELGDNKNEAVSKCLELLSETFDRTKQLISGILEYSNTSLNEIELEEVNLDKLILEIIEQYSMDKDVVINFEKTTFIVKHNKTVLAQVFDNLLSNAIKYNDKERCKIDLQCIDKADHYEVSVSDNGSGIADADKERVFDLFENLKTKKKDSTGIGLATVRKLLSKAGGKIWVETAENKGAKLVFTIKK